VTDLESFQRALKAQDEASQPGPGPHTPDSIALNIGEIMAKGRWLRRRRQAAAVGGSLCLAAAAFAAVTGISHLSRTSSAPALSPATGSVSAGAPRRAASPASPAPEGQVVPTGIQTAAGEVVLYGIRVHLRELPGTTFGIMAALRDASGKLTPEITTNETTGPDTAAGFHAVEGAMTTGTPAVAMPEFGYYAGPAVKITALDGTQHVRARIARWSVNPRVVIFWFTPAADPGGATLHHLAAYNTAGQLLPAGNNAPGVG
jgi:hypothetical protein